MAKKSHRMDPHLIAATDNSELDYVVKKMKKEGIKTTRARVRRLAKDYNNSRKKVYAQLRHDAVS